MGPEAAHWGGLGLIVLAIVVGSMFFIILAATVIGNGKRGRETKVTRIFLGSIGLMLGLFVAFAWVGSAIFGLFLP